LSSKPQNDDVELTTTSEGDGKPSEDDGDCQSESEEDNDKGQKIVACRHAYKVQPFLSPYHLNLLCFDRLLGVNVLAVLR